MYEVYGVVCVGIICTVVCCFTFSFLHMTVWSKFKRLFKKECIN